MATKTAVKNILPEIPITLSVVVGDIVIRFGELERAIFTAMARVRSADNNSDENKDFITLVGEFKEIKTLGKLAEEAKKEFGNRGFDWIDFDALKRLGHHRNAIIHDALMGEQDGTLIWQASSSRTHRQVDYSELLLVRECVVRTIMQINEGSLEYKKKKQTGE